MTAILILSLFFGETQAPKPEITWELAAVEVFGDVAEFDVDDADHLALLVYDQFQLLILDKAGRVIARCGRKGQGPGELMGPSFVRWLPEQRLFAVYDWRRRTLVTWDVAGHLQGEHAMPLSLPDTKRF